MRSVHVVDEVLLHEEAGEAFLLHVPTGKYFGLNAAGVIAWHAIVEDTDPLERLQLRWPNRARDVLAADADALVDALVAAGLVRDESD